MNIVAYLDENKNEITQKQQDPATSGFENNEHKVHRIPPDFPSHPATERKPKYVEWQQIGKSPMGNNWNDELTIDLLALADTFQEIIPNNHMAMYIKSKYDDGESLPSTENSDESTLDTYNTTDVSSYLPTLSEITHTFDDSTIDSGLQNALQNEGTEMEIERGISFDESTIDSSHEHATGKGNDEAIFPDPTFDELTTESRQVHVFDDGSETEIDHNSTTFDDCTFDSTLELKSTCESTFDEFTTDGTLEHHNDDDDDDDDDDDTEVDTDRDATFDDLTADSTFVVEEYDDGSETEIDCDSTFDDCTIDSAEDLDEQRVAVVTLKENISQHLEGFKYDEQHSDIAVVAEEVKATEILNTTESTTMASTLSLNFLPWFGGDKEDTQSMQTTPVDTDDDAPMTTSESIGEEEKSVPNKRANSTVGEKAPLISDEKQNGIDHDIERGECKNSKTPISTKQGEETKDHLLEILGEKEKGEQSEAKPPTESSELPRVEVERKEKQNKPVRDEDKGVMQGREHRLEDMKVILKKTARMERRKKLKKSIQGAFKSLNFLKKKAPFYVDDEGEYDLVVTVVD